MKPLGLAAALVALFTAQHAQAEQAITLCPAAIVQDLPAEQARSRNLRAGQDGWLYSDRDFTLPPQPSSGIQLLMQRFTEALAGQGITLAIAMLPSRAALTEQHFTADIIAGLAHSPAQIRQAYVLKMNALRKAGIIVPDLMTPLYAVHAREQLYFKRDHHWTPRGAALAAASMAEVLRPLPALKDVPEQRFITTTDDTVNHIGRYADFVTKACNLLIPPERREVQHTQKAEASLLDDSTAAIALVGTSYSLEEYNFAGALSEALSREVENHSVDGGGAEDSLIAYLSSRSYATHKPALLIWEVPDVYSLNIGELWRQVIPAAKGACTDANTLSKTTTTNLRGALLQGLADIRIRKGRDYLYFESDDAQLTKYTITFRYANGQDDVLVLERSTRAPFTGRYFVQVSGKIDGNLNEILLKPEGTTGGTISARLCRG